MVCVGSGISFDRNHPLLPYGCVGYSGGDTLIWCCWEPMSLEEREIAERDYLIARGEDVCPYAMTTKDADEFCHAMAAYLGIPKYEVEEAYIKVVEDGIRRVCNNKPKEE